MATVIGKVCAPTGTYIKDGEEKTSWSRCGILMQTDKGFRIKLDTVPIGGDGWFSVFEEEPQSKGSAHKASSRPSEDDDGMPF